MAQILWKRGWRFLRKLGINPPYDTAIPLLGICPEQTRIQKDTCPSMLIAALFTIARQDMCFQRGHGVCLCLMSWCLTILGCLILFSHKFMSSWRGQTVSFCYQWGAWPRTCGYECLLKECSNPVQLTNSV